MTQLTNQQINWMRSRPHRTKLWLSIYQPSTVLAARLNNASAAKGDRFIPFDTVTQGSYLLIQDGMTLYVGSSAGKNDKGELRIRSAVSSGLFVAENAFIDWDDNDYLTAINFFEIQPVFPRIIQDPNDQTKTIWYKDYDIPYTNQNDILGSFINMGSHFAGFLQTGTVSVFYSATGTSYVGSSSNLSYHWFFEGATITGSNSLTPGYIPYTIPGHYTTRLIVSGSAGNVDSSFRHISIYNKPGEGTNVPILDWQLSKLSGSRDAGGYSANIRIFEELQENEVKEGSLVVIFSEDWYGGTKQSFGRNSLNRSNIVFVGYVLNGSLSYNYKDKYLDFEVVSPSGLMKIAKGFSISLEDAPTSRATSDPGNYPSAWVLIPNLDVKKALYHYLRWHSTVLKCLDFQFLGTDQQIQYFDADRESLYNVLDTGMRGILLGKVVNDIQGKLWAETDAYIEDKTINAFVLDNQDWIGDPSIDIQQTNEVSFIEAGGIYYTGFTGTSTPYLSTAPGESPSYQGEIERIQGLALSGQDHLNDITARLYSFKNRKYPKIDFALAGNYPIFDIAPLERFNLFIQPQFNPFGIMINERGSVESLNLVYNPRFESFLSTIGFTQISTGTFSSTLAVPPIPESQGYDVPPITIPPITIPPITVGGGVGTSPILVPAIHSDATDNFDDAENSNAFHHANMSTTSGIPIGGVKFSGNLAGGHSSAGGVFPIPSTASNLLIYPLFYRPYPAGASTDLTLTVYAFPLNGAIADFDTHQTTHNYDLSSSSFNFGFWRADELGISIAPGNRRILSLIMEDDDNGSGDLLPFVGWLIYIT